LGEVTLTLPVLDDDDGVPAGMLEWRRTQRTTAALGVLIAWLAAALPAGFSVTPIG